MSKYPKLRRLIAATFPNIHWEIYSWTKYTGNPEVWEEGKCIEVYGGFIDGWAYKLPGFNAPEGAETDVARALEAQIEAWWVQKNPGLVTKICRLIRSALNGEEGNG